MYKSRALYSEGRRMLNQYKSTLASIGVFVATMGLQNIDANAVTLNGLEWRQLTEVTGFSWSDVSTVCPSGGGLCSGSLTRASDSAAIDFTGWNWATVTEVGNLFAAYTTFPGGTSFLSLPIGTIAGTDLSGLNATFTASNYTQILGWSASAFTTNNSYSPFLLLGTVVDEISTTDSTDKTARLLKMGVWLYKEPPTVPLPAALPLLAAGLGAMGFMGWRRKRRVA